MPLELIVPGDKEETIAYATTHLAEAIRAAYTERGSCSLALSGGSTPKAIYKRLRKHPLEWSRIDLFWSDERSVPPDHPDSNYRMALEAFGDLPFRSINRMVAEGDIEANAAAYVDILPPSLDIVMLGMGADGHTASLFPGTSALEEEKRPVVPVYVEEKKSWRMTLTFPCIRAARMAIVYILGEEKAEMLRDVMGGADVPINRVQGIAIADKKAASLL
jgi:6-phosphogluconolactonase